MIETVPEVKVYKGGSNVLRMKIENNCVCVSIGTQTTIECYSNTPLPEFEEACRIVGIGQKKVKRLESDLEVYSKQSDKMLNELCFLRAEYKTLEKQNAELRNENQIILGEFAKVKEIALNQKEQFEEKIKELSEAKPKAPVIRLVRNGKVRYETEVTEQVRLEADFFGLDPLNWVDPLQGGLVTAGGLALLLRTRMQEITHGYGYKVFLDWLDELSEACRNNPKASIEVIR